MTIPCFAFILFLLEECDICGLKCFVYFNERMKHATGANYIRLFFIIYFCIIPYLATS
ncbi:hypothetical protein F4804DRAFT_308790, partial [Jackrogersella minutella]